uniref:Uncharacterized protein n=1 Tax=Capra hircus TaxID=9925 RepID=A0A8C2RUW3_CAPHI
MELSLSSGGAAEALSWPEMFPGLESDSPLPPEELDAVVPVSGAMAGGMLDRILLESVCQQQSWVRVYGPLATDFYPDFSISNISLLIDRSYNFQRILRKMLNFLFCFMVSCS